MDSEKRFKERIGYRGSIATLSEAICEKFNLGRMTAAKVVPFGYEDFNMTLKTSKGAYFVKIFFAARSAKECDRYVNIIQKSVKAGVNTPKLLGKGRRLTRISAGGADLRLILMESVDGDNFYHLGANLTKEEMKAIAAQASLINKIRIKPDFLYDTWAITSFLKEFKRKRKYLDETDLELVSSVYEEFKDVELDGLPHAFVHGDILKTNVMKDKKSKLWIVDFAVSNYYPRILELAVLACNILFDPDSSAKSQSNLEMAVAEYEKRIKLTDTEHRLLPLFVRAAHAMHLLSANYEKMANGNTSKENEYWLAQGRAGLSGLE